MEISDMKGLTALLCPAASDSESEEEVAGPSRRLGPGDVGAARGRGAGGATEDPKAIWSAGEVPTAGCCDPAEDPRKTPEYDVKFRQCVSTEDIYLQMGNKTPSSASCEELVVTVALPGEERDSVDVHVTGTFLDVRSRQYRLHLALPHPVDPNAGRASWLPHSASLQVAMKMNREFDFVNF